MNDEELIYKANSISCINWQDIIPLIDLAETEETKVKLDNIMKAKYHEEEYYSNML